MSDKPTQEPEETKPEANDEVVVLEKRNYERMMSTFRGLMALSLGLGVALTVSTWKLLSRRQNASR